MQTFLPYPDFERTARVLDWRRLGKQRVEALTLLRCLEAPCGWRHHPAVHMWRGYEDALKAYMNACIDEWERRGYRNNMPRMEHPPDPKMPPWLGDPEFHRSHQSNLIRKDPDYYRHRFPGVPDDLPYVWPTNRRGGNDDTGGKQRAEGDAEAMERGAVEAQGDGYGASPNAKARKIED